MQCCKAKSENLAHILGYQTGLLQNPFQKATANHVNVKGFLKGKILINFYTHSFILILVHHIHSYKGDSKKWLPRQTHMRTIRIGHPGER